ncbi:MAG: class I SAM-dependent methyltransferase [Bacillota bacterium]
MKPANDRDYVRSQYRDAGNLGARQRFHHLYSTNKQNWSSWVFSQVDLPEPATVLELGCGNGGLWLENVERVSHSLEVTLTDVSPGLLQEARRNLTGCGLNLRFEVVDAARIPYDAGSFDVVLANHLLYHLGDINSALAGICRVLRPAGFFYASTVGLGNMSELQDLIRRSGWKVDLDISSASRAFGLENGAGILKRHFRQVDLLQYPDSLQVPTAEAVVEYVSSLYPSETVPGELRNLLQDELDAKGIIHITKSLGMFRCKEPYASAR